MKKLVLMVFLILFIVLAMGITPVINYLASGDVTITGLTKVASGSYTNLPYLFYDSDLTLISTGTVFPKFLYADTQLATTSLATYTYVFDDNYNAKVDIKVPSTSVANWKVYFNTTNYPGVTLEASDSLSLILDTKYIYKLWFVTQTATTSKLDYTIWNYDYVK